MALTRAELQKLVEAEGLRYFIDPSKDALMLGVQGLNGRYQFVIMLELDGTFLQMRTIGYHHCPTGHKHLLPVLQALLRMNYELRLLKIGWDATDGEIVAYADLWIMDAQVTHEQMSRMLHNYVPALDACYARIVQTLETGRDPGAQDPAAAVASMAGGSVPAPLRKLLESLEKAARDAGGAGEGEKGDKKKESAKKVTKL
jgi:hypothetical protein